MTKETIESHLFYRLRAIANLKPENIPQKLEEFLADKKPRSKRTSSQNNALHKDCALIAEKLNDAGKDMRQVMKQDVFLPWTTDSVKEYIFKPIMKAMYQKESTKELEKGSGEIDKIHEVIMRELGQKHGIEWHDFPHDPLKKQDMIEMMKPREMGDVEYPTEHAPADKF